MLTLDQKKTATVVLGGLALVGALAGCSATPAGTNDDIATPDTEATTPAESGTGTTTGSYTDGTYTEGGTYQSPGGTESIEVTLTLADGVITAVEVTGEASDGQAKVYQGQFTSGISAVVVGKSIDEIQVDKVGGSSLTSGGFKAAVEAIKADALQPEIRPHSLTFEAIGTGWQLDTAEPISAELERAIAERIEAFDRTWSRFRDDSLVSRIAAAAGVWPFPDDAPSLFDLYRRLYDATDGALSPLVGRTLESLGYDRTYSLRASATPAAVPAWADAIAWDGAALTTIRPVTLDVGAAGKGYLVDIVSAMLTEAGHEEFIVDGSGDIRHRGAGVMRVALEHPLDTTKAIGIANVGNGAICSSATNRRTWGNGLHHVIDATTGLPVRGVIATWAIAATALEADGLATALFFTEPDRLAESFHFSYVRLHSTGRVEFSPHFDGEMFL